VFQLLALATLPIAANSLGNASMNLEHQTGGVVMVQATVATVALALSWPFMQWGLTGVGLAILGGHIAGNVVTVAFVLRGKIRFGTSQDS
jgi:O-antigen/teichoic acid export membrane protein